MVSTYSHYSLRQGMDYSLIHTVSEIIHFHSQGDRMVDIFENPQTITWDEGEIIERAEVIDVLSRW